MVSCACKKAFIFFLIEMNSKMMNSISPFSRMKVSVACALMLFSVSAVAQESANAELDACVQKQQLKSTAKGAAVGALAGLGASLFTGAKKNDTLKATALGAVAGGGIGFVKAYYEATSKCYKKNPSWVPASNITRSATLEQAKKTAKYKPSEGIKAVIVGIDMPATVTVGTEKIAMNTKFLVLTPDDAETPVEIERKVYVIEDGKEELIPFTATQATETRTFEPAEHTDMINYTLTPDFKAGMKLRYEILLKVADKPAVTASKVVEIK